MGQTEAWYTTDYLTKRLKLETTSHLPVYPQRAGEKDCTHYMQTRTCKFGEGCKFDHPIWVPEGGIPDWKEVIVYYNYLKYLHYNDFLLWIYAIYLYVYTTRVCV